MSRKKEKEELIDSIKSLIISYDVEIEAAEDRVASLRRERGILEKRLLEEN